jgi:hypothetical protein
MDAATIEKVNKRERMGTVGEASQTTKELLKRSTAVPRNTAPEQARRRPASRQIRRDQRFGYQIKRGKLVRVPESVYLVLVESGEVAPQREEDESHVPQMTYTYGAPISQQVAQNVQ